MIQVKFSINIITHSGDEDLQFGRLGQQALWSYLPSHEGEPERPLQKPEVFTVVELHLIQMWATEATP